MWDLNKTLLRSDTCPNIIPHYPTTVPLFTQIRPCFAQETFNKVCSTYKIRRYVASTLVIRIRNNCDCLDTMRLPPGTGKGDHKRIQKHRRTQGEWHRRVLGDQQNNKVEQVERGMRLIIAGNNRRPLLSFKENIKIKKECAQWCIWTWTWCINMTDAAIIPSMKDTTCLCCTCPETNLIGMNSCPNVGQLVSKMGTLIPNWLVRAHLSSCKTLMGYITTTQSGKNYQTPT